MDYSLNDAWGFVAANWDTAAGIAVSMFALTMAAGVLIRPEHKETIALWLMGAGTERTWAQSFVSLFDNLFGGRHLSPKCMARSSIASLMAVVAIWLLLGEFGALPLRVQAELSVGGFLLAVLAVNIVADYVSLLETRLLLGWLTPGRPVWMQTGVLAVDLLLTTAIIWVALLAYLNSPLHEGEVESFAEILGVFSIFSVLFYSTFLTSVWTWSYILSSWILRLLHHARLGAWLHVERRPITILAGILSGTVFLGALAAGPFFQKGEDGITAVERTLCSVFKGRVCLDVAKLTVTEQWALDYILLACAGGLTEECVRRGVASVQPDQAAQLFRAACSGDDARSCYILGIFHEIGLGVTKDYTEVVRLFDRACTTGYSTSCIKLGVLYLSGTGLAPDPHEAARYFGKACDAGIASACRLAADIISE